MHLFLLGCSAPMLPVANHEDNQMFLAGNGKLTCMVDPARLKLLVALHEQGTLHAAASTLHISPSAASQQLATLTREAGVPLAEADGRKLRLTDAGLVLVEHAYAMLALVERAMGEVQATVNGELGRITVGSFPSTISSLLIPAALMLRDSHPRLRVDIREITAPDCRDRLAGGELDVVVEVEAEGAPSGDDARCTRVELGTDDFDLALPIGHPSAREPSVGLSRLRDEEWVSTIEGDACDRLLHLACASAGFRPRVRHRAGDWTAILALVEAEMGIAFVPRAARLPIPAGVVSVAPTGHDIRRHVYAAVRRGSEARPAIAAYLAALEAVAARGYRPRRAADSDS
ncbi:LysR family transcriptional regulator [Nonomuraea longispora]|uniref:LysR family transcriptional regulator n=2 Tax=Nonomuraea longispora TaxID=1848320 RepID=A0A4R4MUM0_9ACTN|nr:LysR family transcriptional regulator [Nonomuraea longispora]